MGPAPIGNIKFDNSVLNNTELPDDTKIEFAIVLIDQQGNDVGYMFQEFRSGDMLNTTGWNYTDAMDAYQYKMTVTVTQPEGQTEPAIIDSLGFTTTYLAAPTYVNTELIAPASNLSAMPLVNYTTWLRWTSSPTEGAVYDIYRSESDVLDLETMEPIASNLTATYYYDHDLVPGKTFNYWVVAKKEYQVEGETVTMYAQSQPSPKQTATMVDENELNKQLGLQDYWSYVQLPIGNASGYINTSSGNLAYQQVDVAISAPLLASTMRRTYNSQAKSYTALGKGWDFGLNTNLLREYDKTTGEEVGLILKDGDGTVHRFAKQEDGSYKSPAGVFITLSQREDGKYTAHRSDDIDYLFNESMMIEEFSEPNGNKLLFTYDERGRLVKVMHSLYTEEAFTEDEQKYLAFEYGEQPHNQDKIIKVIAHYSGTGDTAVEDVYQYTYGSDENDPSTYGMLLKVATAGEQTYTYVETNAEGVDTVSSTTSTKTIEESYTYQDSDINGFTVKMPSNTSETGIRTYSFEEDGSERVTKYTDAVGNYGTLSYEIVVTGKPEEFESANIQKVSIIGYEGDTVISNTEVWTDQDLYGVPVKTVSDGNKVVLLGDYDARVLKAQTYTTYRDQEHTQPIIQHAEYNENGTMASQIGADGVRTEYQYRVDEEGRLTQQATSIKSYQDDVLLNWKESSYDEKGNLLSETTAVKSTSTADNRTTTYTYNERGLKTSQTEWNGKVTSYSYDKFGTLSTQESSGGGITEKVSYTYDVYGCPLTSYTERNGKNVVTTYTYDGFGRLIETKDADGQRVVNNYNKNGLIVSKVEQGASVDGGTTQARVETYEYDDIDRLVKTINPIGNVITVQTDYTPEEKVVTTTTNGQDGVTRTSVAKTALDGSYSIELNGGFGQKTYLDYEGNAYKITQVSPSGEERPMFAEHDDLGRVIRIYDENQIVESRTDYDVYGNTLRDWTFVKIEDGVRKYSVKQYSYDLLGRVTSVREKASLMPYQNADVGIASTDAVTTYTYDAVAGNETLNVITGADGSVAKTYYNAMGLVTKEEQLGKGEGANIVKTYEYDAYGRQTAIKAGAGSVSTRMQYEYDQFDRLTKHIKGSDKTTYTYDYFGRRASMEDRQGDLTILTTWKYDKSNQPVQLVQDGKVVNYRYNSAGEMTAMQYGAQGNVRTIGYEYDDAGKLIAIKSSVRPAAADGAPMDTSQLKTVKSYTYGDNGELAHETEYLEFDHKEDKQGLTVVGTYQYDSLGRATGISYAQNGTEIEKYTLTYDGRGYTVSETYTDAYKDSYTDNKVQTTQRDYVYDAIGRLQESVVTQGADIRTTGYEYDKGGNRLKESITQTKGEFTDSRVRNYTYNNLNQLMEIKESGTLDQEEQDPVTYTNITMQTYTYDAYGNQIGQVNYELSDEVPLVGVKSSEIRNTYDNANQLIKTEQKEEGGSWKTLDTSVYNGEGQRVRKVDGDSTNGDYTMYFYMSGALAFSTNSDANFVTDENILDPYGTIVAGKRQDNMFNAEKPEGQYWIFHYDPRDSVTNVIGTDKDGKLYRAENNVYDAFGKQDGVEEKPTSSIKNEVKFTGGVEDTNGTYYLGSRNYDPNTGRFLQQDTYTGNVFEPWTQNLYTYTSNNPINYVDPTGHWSYPCKINTPYYKPGQTYNEVMAMWRNKDTPKATNETVMITVTAGTTSKTGGGSTPGTNPRKVPRNFKIGTMYHEIAIASVVAEQLQTATTLRKDNGIPGGGPHGGYGYIDIKLGSSIWEVKSLASAQRGRGTAQLNRYIEASKQQNALDPSKPVLQKGYPIERLEVTVMGGTLIIDNYYLPGTDKNNLRPNEYSGIITYQYEESAEAQHATQVARDATLKGIKLGALFWLLFLTGQLYPGAAGVPAGAY